LAEFRTVANNHSLITDAFSSDENRIMQWQSFLAKSKLEELTFQEVHRTIVTVLGPVYDDLATASS
jgi:hypothetical protein